MLRSFLSWLFRRRAPKAAPVLVMGYPHAVQMKGGGYAPFPGAAPERDA